MFSCSSATTHTQIPRFWAGAYIPCLRVDPSTSIDSEGVHPGPKP